ncbi:MAG: electron transfer flavoprotein subunit alpha/FixB family protein [Bacteroidetes bacterium]|nr:electron transfer flavoprotein subunit alpha/FixB family protein [Bacteroidota bacterium]
MSVLVYIENSEGTFRKSAFETISYASAIAAKLNKPLVAISIGNVSNDELAKAGQYGATKVLNAAGDKLSTPNTQAYSSVIAAAAKAENAEVIVLSASFAGKTIAPRIAIKLDAGLAENVVTLPEMDGAFTVKKGSYSGKAYSIIEMLAGTKVISTMPNSYKVVPNAQTAQVVNFDFTPDSKDFAATVKERVKAGNAISLPEAELVVSAGRGMKGPENWGMIEELAKTLGAATACSKPVSDAGWRPHSEHVGQTGIAISPNLYIAVGISGAIQHLAGVSSSKVIVVVNKDPEAPFFKAADYGIVGDAFEVVPKLIEAAKAFKASQN